MYVDYYLKTNQSIKNVTPRAEADFLLYKGEIFVFNLHTTRNKYVVKCILQRNYNPKWPFECFGML